MPFIAKTKSDEHERESPMASHGKMLSNMDQTEDTISPLQLDSVNIFNDDQMYMTSGRNDRYSNNLDGNNDKNNREQVDDLIDDIMSDDDK